MSFKKKWTSKILLSGIFLGLIACVVFSKSSLDAHRKSQSSREDLRLLPTPRIAKILSFGYEPAVSDIYWIEGINYFGKELLSKNRTQRYLQAYTDIIYELDPLFTFFFDWASTIFIYSGMEVTREKIILSTEYANRGIQNLNAVHRFDYNMIIKGAFNYALEAQQFAPAIPYFELAGRSFPERRDTLLVASAYAQRARLGDRSADLRLEYLGLTAFESQNRQQLFNAISIVTSSSFSSQVIPFIKGLRVQMEKDEEVQKLVKNRIQSQSVIQRSAYGEKTLGLTDPRIEKLLSVDFSRTWMPPEMLVLYSL